MQDDFVGGNTMTISFIKSSQKKDILKELNEQFGVQDLPYLLIQFGKEKIKAFSGSLSKEEIMDISRIANIELIGTYLIKKESDYRLSFDATQILSSQFTKNIFDINDEQYELWIRGYDLQINAPKGTILIRYKGDFLGCGKSSGTIVYNYVPKERRLKTQIPKK